MPDLPADLERPARIDAYAESACNPQSGSLIMTSDFPVHVCRETVLQLIELQVESVALSRFVTGFLGAFPDFLPESRENARRPVRS
jgi:hypothetical protein